MSHAAPIAWISVPKFPNRLATQSARNVGTPNGLVSSVGDAVTPFSASSVRPEFCMGAERYTIGDAKMQAGRRCQRCRSQYIVGIIAHGYYVIRMSDILGFLIGDVSRLMRRRFDERARAIGVTRAQWRALTKLSRAEGINQGGLAEALEVEPITLCRMIDRLEEAGLVERRRDPSDRRAWRIFLTDKARPMIEQLNVVADGLFDDALAGLDEAEQQALFASLTRIRENLNDVPQDEEARHG